MDALTQHARLPALRERYLAAQLRGDRREALRVITSEGIDAGLDAAGLSRVVRDAQCEIGKLWMEDRISIAEEHVATAMSQLVLSVIYQHARRKPARNKRIAVACVEGEMHDFPARLVADALDLDGYDVQFLGANVPAHHLVRALEKQPPDLVALSVTMGFHVPAAREAVGLLRARFPGLPIALGGGACEWSKGLARELAAEVTGCDADEFLAATARCLGVDDG